MALTRPAGFARRNRLAATPPRSRGNTTRTHCWRRLRWTCGPGLHAGWQLHSNPVRCAGPPDVKRGAQHAIALHAAHARRFHVHAAPRRDGPRALHTRASRLPPCDCTPGRAGAHWQSFTRAVSASSGGVHTPREQPSSPAARWARLSPPAGRSRDRQPRRPGRRRDEKARCLAHLDSAAPCIDGDHAQAVCVGMRLHTEHLCHQHLHLHGAELVRLQRWLDPIVVEWCDEQQHRNAPPQHPLPDPP